MGGKAMLIGLILGIVAILFSVVLEGGSLIGLLNLPAAVLVIGGTVGAMLTCHPLEDFISAVKAIRTILAHPAPDFEKIALDLIQVAETARREGLLSLENMNHPDPYINEGLQIVSDGMDPQMTERILVSKIETEQQEMQRKASVYDTLGSYAPTMGIVGTVVGLINVLAHLEDAESLGHSIAGAFAATLYGIALANLVFLPIGARIRSISNEILRQREMTLEGILSVCNGENPRVVELKMTTFLEKPTGKLGQSDDAA